MGGDRKKKAEIDVRYLAADLFKVALFKNKRNSQRPILNVFG